MKDTNASIHRRHGWLDHLAIAMATVCAIHCLLTPVLIMVIPIIATSFFVHQDFHLWMIFLVLPTTVFAIFMGCRNHKDRMVLALSAIGLSILLLALIQERVCYASEGDVAVTITTRRMPVGSCPRTYHRRRILPLSVQSECSHALLLGR